MTQFLTDVVVSVLTDALTATAIVVVPLMIAFYAGRWMGIKKGMDDIQKETYGIQTMHRKL